MNRIKKGDTIIVTTGRSKKHIGKVLRVIGEKVVVEGANIIKKHVRPNPQLQVEGGILAFEAPLHVSNVAHYNPTTKKADKIGFKLITKEGKTYKVRYFKSNNELLDLI